MRFSLSQTALQPDPIRRALLREDAGGFVSFEGWVRDHHTGRTVARLDYEAYPALAVSEGNTIIAEALERFTILDARAVHRCGVLVPGDLAVWIGVCAAHREAAFAATRFLIDTIKARVPIWKHEFYTDGSDVWVDPTTAPPPKATF